MVEFQTIQQRGFHNTYDENGEIDGFEFSFVPKYYKGLWFTQCRFGNVVVDDEVFDRDSKGGLSIGYHDVSLQFGWVLNYNGALEAEPDGSGLGNMAHMFGVDHSRRMLLCR